MSVLFTSIKVYLSTKRFDLTLALYTHTNFLASIDIHMILLAMSIELGIMITPLFLQHVGHQRRSNAMLIK